MSTDLQRDILYIPRLSGGQPLGGKISLGFLVVTESNLFYIPVHTQELKSDCVLGSDSKMLITDVRTYDDINLWEIVPTKAETLGPRELDKYLQKMASEIEESQVVSRGQIRSIKVGLMRVNIDAGEQSFSLNLGIAPRKRKQLQNYLAANGIVEAFDVSAGKPSIGMTSIVTAAIAALIITMGYFGGEGTKDLPSIKEARSQISQSMAILEQARDSQGRANQFRFRADSLKRRNQQLFADLKIKMAAGAPKHTLKGMAQKIRDIEKEEKGARKRACSLTAEYISLELEAREVSLEAHKILRSMAQEPASTEKVSGIIAQTESRIVELKSKSRLQAKRNCVAS